MNVRNALAVVASIAALVGIGGGIASAAPVSEVTPTTAIVEDDQVELGASIEIPVNGTGGIVLWSPQVVLAFGVFDGQLVGGFGPR